MNKINSSDLWLVLDIGTTELKGALMNSEGVIQEESSRPNQTYTPSSGFEEQKAENWWEKACEILSELGYSETEVNQFKTKGVV